MGKDDRLIFTLNRNRKGNNEYKKFCKEWDEVEKYHSDKKDDNSRRVIRIIDKRNKPVEFHNEKKKLFDDKLIERLNRERRNIERNLKEYEEGNKPADLDNLNSVLEGSKEVMKKVEEQFDKPIHEDRYDVLKDIANTLKDISKKLDSIKGLLIEK